MRVFTTIAALTIALSVPCHVVSAEPKHPPTDIDQGKWETGVFDKNRPLMGPFTVTFLRTAVDPAAPKKQFVVWTGSGSDVWFSVDDFSGTLYLPPGTKLITREDHSPRSVIYSGYRPDN